MVYAGAQTADYTNTLHERIVGAILLVPTGSISGSVRFVCLGTLKPEVMT